MSRDHDLQRFVEAQADSYDAALAELRRGAKRSHWIWYIFPQVAGLGSSAMSQRYAIHSTDEARAYLDHPILGARLRECLSALASLPPTTAEAVFGTIDAAKLRSSLTLFVAAGGGAPFEAALQRWFAGQPDEATLQRLAT